MIDMYCAAHHASTRTLCVDCLQLREYALLKIDRCRFSVAKPVCAQCRVHCYRREMRERIRQVMRFSGPRMLLHHPFMALLHMVDRLRHTAS